MMATIYCNRCGSPNIGDAAFCSKCGSAFARAGDEVAPAPRPSAAASQELAANARPAASAVPMAQARTRRLVVLGGALVVVLVTGLLVVRLAGEFTSSHESDGQQVAQVSDQVQELRQQVADETADRKRHDAAEWLARARAEAPSKVTVEQMGCSCASGHRIIVTCRVSSAAQVPVSVDLAATGKTGILGATGKATKTVALAPQQTLVEQVETKFNGLLDCSSAGGCSCDKVGVTIPRTNPPAGVPTPDEQSNLRDMLNSAKDDATRAKLEAQLKEAEQKTRNAQRRTGGKPCNCPPGDPLCKCM